MRLSLSCTPLLPAAVRPCLEAPLHKRLDRRELVSLALVADAAAERADKVSLACTNTVSAQHSQHSQPHSLGAAAGASAGNSCATFATAT